MKLTYITKDTSKSFKGFALLLMVFLHLFNQEVNVKDLFSLFNVDGVPFVHFLARGCNPVGLYLMASGYGIYYLCKKRMGGGKNRLLKLYITYWITLLMFVGLGSFMKPDVYPGTWTKIIENATAFHTTYYAEAWFLFPYVLLSLTSPILFKIVERWSVKIVLPIVFFLNYLALFLTSRYYDVFFATHHSIYHIVLYFNCLYSFIIGTYFCKYSEMEVKHEWQKKTLSCQPILVVAFIILFFSNCLIHSAAFGPFYQPAIAFIFIHINWYKPIEKFYQFLGKYSTVVWLVHTWFCYYLFKNFIYGLHYPIIILSLELALSVVAGFAIQKITKCVFRIFNL